MRTKTDIDLRNTQKAHQSKMKRLNSHHKNELDAVKNKHIKNKNDLSAAHQDQLHLQKVNHDNRLAIRSIENEKTYNKLQENLNQVKDRIAKTKSDLEIKHDEERKSTRLLHQLKLDVSNQENVLKVADANDATTQEINRLRRRYNAEKESLINQNLNEKSIIEGQHKNETQIEKHVYRKKHARLVDENARALFNIKKDHSRVKNREERANLKEIKAKREIWGNEISKIDQDGILKKSIKQKEFEKDYAIQYKKHEDLAKTLMRNKEKIVKEFTDELTHKFEIGAAKHNDPFYEFGTLDVDIDETFDNNGYDISIPIAEHEANKIKLVGEGRNIRLTMEREHSNTITEDGETNKMSKIETYTANRTVEDLVDPTTVTKKYENGNLIFRILKA